MQQIPDHPQIASALETGYPSPVHESFVICCDCEKQLTDDDTVYIWEGDNICDECLKERIEEKIPIQTIAEALGISWKKAYLLEDGE